MYSQENLTGNHNSILPTIYISIHGPCYNCALSYPNVHALSSCPLLIYHASTSRLPCHVHVPWCHTFLISVIHVCTMCTPWGIYVPWHHSISRLFPILLDPNVIILILKVGYKNNSCIRETQENLIEIPLQSSLPYILLPMVRAYYCTPYPNWPCVEHEANMCYPCCMMSLCSKSFY